MSNSRSSTEGPQLDLTFAGETGNYSDGESEQFLLDLFAEPAERERRVQEALASRPSWPVLYHLSPVRENLLSWYPFAEGASLLEIGAGCGALTGLFCSRVAQVTALELTHTRAEILRRRCSDRSNLRILVGNVEAIPLQPEYDYVTCIGVLEYAERFISGPEPTPAFLTKVASALRPKGTLILAIENRFGLKYWSGSPEDHTGRVFESLEGYPLRPGVRTFGREELAELLHSVGFARLRFYYPLPDYKLPLEIFSDDYLPSDAHPLRPGAVGTDPNPQIHLFHDRLVMDGLIANGLFPPFANSFLIFAEKEGA